MDILSTDWAAMTLNDWTGLTITIVVFFLMVWAYAMTFNPKNKEKLESQRNIIFEENDDLNPTSTTEDSKK